MPTRTPRRLLLALLPALLFGCGGGNDSGAPAPDSCSVADQKALLGSYMDGWYFWYRLSPRPDPSAYPGIDDYFDGFAASCAMAEDFGQPLAARPSRCSPPRAASQTPASARCSSRRGRCRPRAGRPNGYGSNPASGAR